MCRCPLLFGVACPSMWGEDGICQEMRSLIGLPKAVLWQVWCIPILEDGLLECDISSDQSLDSLTPISALQYGAETMVDSPGR